MVGNETGNAALLGLLLQVVGGGLILGDALDDVQLGSLGRAEAYATAIK